MSRLAAGLLPVAADLADPAAAALPAAVDAVVYAAAADESSDEAYRRAYVDGQRKLHAALAAAGASPARWLFVSSTGVHAQADGETVDEESPAEPDRFSGRRLLEGERFAATAASVAVSVRFGGIYGPGRNRLVETVRRGGACRERPRPPRAALGDGPARGSKRCSNARLLASGYRFLYPSWREGYAAVLETMLP